MKTRIGLSLLLATLLGAFCLLTPRVSASNAAATHARLLHKTYRIGDLPVWTKDGQFQPQFLMHSIQSSVSPKIWEANGGKSSMSPYDKNSSLVISTTQECHHQINDFLENYR